MMNKARLAAFLVLFASAAGATTRAERTIQGWPAQNKQAAQTLIEKYGQPDSIVGDRLEWYRRGDFKRVAVDGRAAPDAMVENTVNYQAPQDSGLVSLDAVVTPDTGKRELTSCGRSEGANTLALNLADGVMNGRMTADQARAQSQRVLKLEKSGKSSPAAERLQFRPGWEPIWNDQNSGPY